MTQGEAALRIGVCRQTVVRWNQQAAFRDEVAALAREIADNQIHIVNTLQQRTLRALSEELLDGRTRGWAALNLLRMFGPEKLFTRPETDSLLSPPENPYHFTGLEKEAAEQQ